MSYMHHLSTGGEPPTNVFPQTPPESYFEEILAEELQERFADGQILPEVDSAAYLARDYSTPDPAKPFGHLGPNYCAAHGNRVGSASGGEHLCGPCEDGEPAPEFDAEIEDHDDEPNCEICSLPSTVLDPVAHFKSQKDPAEYVMAHAGCGEGYELELA